MSTDYSWTVIQIPTPASEEHTALYRSVRLSALFTNPEVFASSYESESTLSDRTWSSRINTPARYTLIAILTDKGSPIGTLSVHGPDMLAGLPKERPYPPLLVEEERRDETDIYVLVGMWVQPEYRGRGVGKTLVDYALEIVKLAPSNEEYQLGSNLRGKKELHFFWRITNSTQPNAYIKGRVLWSRRKVIFLGSSRAG